MILKLFKRNFFSYILFLFFVSIVALFFYREFKKNLDIFYNYSFVFKFYYIIISFFITFTAFIIDTYILQVCINKHTERNKISFLTNMAILNASNICKYIPGFIWGYATQILWFSKKGISKSRVLYANFICCIGAIIVCIFLGNYVCHILFAKHAVWKWIDIDSFLYS